MVSCDYNDAEEKLAAKDLVPPFEDGVMIRSLSAAAI